MIRIDTREVQRLANDLTESGTRLNRAVLPIMKRAGGNMVRDSRARVKAAMGKHGYTRLPHYPRSITTDTVQTAGSTRTDVGPDRAMKQGPLGPGVEYGTVHTDAIHHNIPALTTEAPRAERQLLDAASKLLRR